MAGTVAAGVAPPSLPPAAVCGSVAPPGTMTLARPIVTTTEPTNARASTVTDLNQSPIRGECMSGIHRWSADGRGCESVGRPRERGDRGRDGGTRREAPPAMVRLLPGPAAGLGAGHLDHLPH